jgi:TldD protein
MLALAERAVEAAVAAGATYSDVRLTHTMSEHYTGAYLGRQNDNNLATPSDSLRWRPNIDMSGAGIARRPDSVAGIPTLHIGIGVRALINGYWGFASSPVWTDDETVRLGREAASQAALNARAGRSRSVELGTIPIVRRGRWVQPGIDPFAVSIDEKLDVLRMMLDLPVQGFRFGVAAVGPQGSLALWRETRVFASSEGASYTQVRYRCEPRPIYLGFRGDWERGEQDGVWEMAWNPEPLTGRGWESIRDLDWATIAKGLLAQARAQTRERAAASKPVQVGQYDVVFGASATANILYHTLSKATELDRALGYEANASGTSYLGPDPFQWLGTAVTSPLITLTANRTIPHALGTVAWDDEGVAGTEFPLIQDGVLVDYQSTRELAQGLAPWYAKQGKTVPLHGCAVAETALDYPIQMNPNFVLQPGSEAVQVEDLIKDTKLGVYFPSADTDADQQSRNGIAVTMPGPREIRNGRLGGTLTGAAVLFSSMDFWKSVQAIGGPGSAQYSTQNEMKGEPSQQSSCNVCAVPMKVTKCNVIDFKKKA